jgi:predicted ATPase
MIKRIILEGFKSIRELDLELRPLNVLIGANGAGKSNFIAVLHLLNEMINGNFQDAVARAGGAETFLCFGKKVTNHIKVELHFPPNGYRCSWKPAADDTLYFGEEACLYWGWKPEPHETPLGTGHKESKLPGEAAEERPHKVPYYVMEAFKSWRVYHFHDTSSTAGVKTSGGINDNLYFRSDASNLAAFLYALKNRSGNYYTAIRDTIRQVAPFFDDFLLRPDQTNDGKIRLEWREKGTDYPFMAHHLSDGTLRFMCLATLLLQPTPPSTILIDEPELGLHPYAITMLAALMQSASKKTQVIVSTQSVPLVNQLQPEDILVVDRQSGQSTFKHLEKDEIRGWLDDYGLGDVWEKNLLGGRP